MPVRIVFIGTVEFSRRMLDALLKRDEDVRAVYSLVRGRAGAVPDWSDLREPARERRIEHHEARRVNSPQHLTRIREINPDVILVMGFPEILPREILCAPRLGTIGSHPSLLPRYRGRDAIPRQILNGETEGGLTFFLMDEGVCTGPVVSQRRFPITLSDTARTVYENVVAAGEEMLGELMSKLEAGAPAGAAQDESQATQLRVRQRTSRRIDWRQNARKIYDLVRATTDPYPGAFCRLSSDKLIVWEAGFSHEPVEARPGEVVKISDRGVEVAAGAGLIVLRVVQTGPVRERALDAFTRADVEIGDVLT